MNDFVVERGKLKYETVTLSAGEWMVVCRQEGVAVLLGMVWGTCTTSGTGKQYYFVHGSYIPEWARRQGVRTAINDFIFGCGIDYIKTPGATADGAAFMTAAGYQRDVYGDYYLQRPLTPTPGHDKRKKR